MSFAGLAMLAALFVSTSPPVQGASLDKALLLKTGDVLAYLKEKNIKNVGVLPFQVQRGDRKAAVGTTPLSMNLPESIENSLIMVMEPDEKRAVGIIRNSTATVSRAKIGLYRTKKDAYDKLYSLSYDLAWGGKKVKADAFLTGTVVNAGPNRGETTVEIQLLRANSWKNGKPTPEKTWTIKTRTDTMLVSNLGYNFSLSPTVLKRGLVKANSKSKAVRRDETVVEQVTHEDDGDKTPGPGQTREHTPTNICGFAFELEYNGVKQPIVEENGGYRAPRPNMGDVITMHLTRTDGDPGKRGVLLLVNGLSTFNKQDIDPNQMRKWIYGPDSKDRRDMYEGFYTGTSGKNLLKFKTLTAEESEGHMEKMGENFGQIRVIVFGSSEKETPENGNQNKKADKKKKPEEIDIDEKDDKKKDDKADTKKEETASEDKKDDKKKPDDKDDKATTDDDKDMLVTSRGMVSKTNNLPLKKLRANLMKANNVRERERLVARRSAGGLILHEMEPVEGGNIATSDLPDATILGQLMITYYDKPSAPITDDK
jgi:hypothetical protein